MDAAAELEDLSWRWRPLLAGTTNPKLLGVVTASPEIRDFDWKVSFSCPTSTSAAARRPAPAPAAPAANVIDRTPGNDSFRRFFRLRFRPRFGFHRFDENDGAAVNGCRLECSAKRSTGPAIVPTSSSSPPALLCIPFFPFLALL